jgi:hypothetical protein
VDIPYSEGWKPRASRLYSHRTRQTRVGEDDVPLIYRVLSPAMADFTCFEKKLPAHADLCVWETLDQAVARSQSGVWCFVTSKAAAQFSVWFTYSASLAEFSLCFVPSREFAGWQKPHPLSDQL